jgi:uracil-DNA glycosylase
LAYAFTIHKSQGSSVDCALVDIGSGNFEFGQAYVALSRVRSLDALYLYDFEPRVFRAHPKVKAFYEKMKSLDIGAYREAIQVVQEVEAVEEKRQEVQEAVPGDNWLYNSLPEGWKEALVECEEVLGKLSVSLETGGAFLPAREQIWSALEKTPLDHVRVVILGQDPYPTPGHAHGMAFSVLDGVRPLPPSLQNIRKELVADVGGCSGQGSLLHWAEQGILLLNTVLTVEPGKPQSHAKMGWEAVTDCILRLIAEQGRPIFFVFWGKSAQAKKKLLPALCPHRVHESAHPSPLSAHKGFFGSRPFSAIQQWLRERGEAEIQW